MCDFLLYAEANFRLEIEYSEPGLNPDSREFPGVDLHPNNKLATSKFHLKWASCCILDTEPQQQTRTERCNPWMLSFAITYKYAIKLRKINDIRTNKRSEEQCFPSNIWVTSQAFKVVRGWSIKQTFVPQSPRISQHSLFHWNKPHRSHQRQNCSQLKPPQISPFPTSLINHQWLCQILHSLCITCS